MLASGCSWQGGRTSWWSGTRSGYVFRTFDRTPNDASAIQTRRPSLLSTSMSPPLAYIMQSNPSDSHFVHYPRGDKVYYYRPEISSISTARGTLWTHLILQATLDRAAMSISTKRFCKKQTKTYFPRIEKVEGVNTILDGLHQADCPLPELFHQIFPLADAYTMLACTYHPSRRQITL